MRDESRHRAQQLLKLHRRQTGNNLVDDIEACSLPCLIPGKRNVEEHGSAPLNLHFAFCKIYFWLLLFYDKKEGTENRANGTQEMAQGGAEPRHIDHLLTHPTFIVI